MSVHTKRTFVMLARRPPNTSCGNVSDYNQPPSGNHKKESNISPFFGLSLIIEDVSINNEYEYQNDFKPYSYSKSFSQLSMLAMTPSPSL